MLEKEFALPYFEFVYDEHEALVIVCREIVGNFETRNDKMSRGMNLSREIIFFRRFLKRNYAELLTVLLLFVDLFVQILPVPLLFFPILLMQFLRLDLPSNIILCLQCLSVIMGAALNTMRISGIGGTITIAGVFLLFYGLKTRKVRIPSRALLGFGLLCLMLAFFGVSSMLSSGGDFSGAKFLKTVISGILFLTSFTVLFCNIRKVNTNRLALYFVLYSFYLLRLSIPANTITGPSGLFDFAFMRIQSIATLGYLPEVFNVFYQLPGQFFMQGLGLFLIRNHRSVTVPSFVFFLGFVVVLYSGARQMIITIMLVFVLWLVLKYRTRSIPVLAAFVLVVPLIYLSSSNLNELFSSTVEDGYVEGGGRGLWLLAGVEQFLENPVFGVGFGRFNLLGDYTTYPHNLFIEILCETGIVGFSFIFSLFLVTILFTRKYLKNYIYYLAGLFLMSMASGAIYDNIILFVLVFAATSLVKIKVQIRFNDDRKVQNHKLAEVPGR